MGNQPTPYPWEARQASHNKDLWEVMGPPENIGTGIPTRALIATTSKANADLIVAYHNLLEKAKKVINAWSHGDFVSLNQADRNNGNRALGDLARAISEAKGEV